RRFLEREGPFALAGGFLDGPDGAIARVAESAGIPVVGTLSPPGPRAGPRRPIFHLYGGHGEQCRILAAFAAARAAPGTACPAVIYEEASARDLAEVVQGEWQRSGGAGLAAALDAGGVNAGQVAARMREGGVERVL